MKQESLYVTRPTLATLLMEQGYTAPKVIPNPWDPALRTWVFPMDENTATIAEAFYEDRGLKPPAGVANFLYGGAR